MVQITVYPFEGLLELDPIFLNAFDDLGIDHKEMIDLEEDEIEKEIEEYIKKHYGILRFQYSWQSIINY